VDEQHKLKVALWRLGLLGPAISARRQHGELQEMFREAAERAYERWDGIEVRVAARTIEEWYYRYQKGGLEALEPRERSDAGETRAIRPELAELILAAKRERPRRSIRRIIRMLERAGKVPGGELKKSSVHRLLQARGCSERPKRDAETERRSYGLALPGDLWVGDVMHGPRVLVPPSPRLHKAYLHLFIDSASRYTPGGAFRLRETAAHHEAVLKQAMQSHGLPRALYEDRGAAQTSLSLKLICAELGVALLHTRPRDPEAKGVIERLFETIRAEILDELPSEPIDLATLNSLLWSWLSAEYHRRRHDTTKREPLEHWLSQLEPIRPAPRGEEMDRIFLHRQHRTVRNDGTVRFKGRLLEVRGELRGQQVELRFDPFRLERLPQVYLDRRFYCDTVELDRVRNSRRPRRKLVSTSEPAAPAATGLDPLRLIQDEHDRRTAPPAQPTKPKPEKE
jgi:transposase InsO family protein